MSYCRWSTDDFQCDLYIYEDCNGGWTCLVAGRRRIYMAPLPPPVSLVSGAIDLFMQRHKTVDDMWQAQIDQYGEDAPENWLDLSTVSENAGETFNVATPGQMADLVESLLAEGFKAPDYVAQDLRDEQKQMDEEE